MDFKSFLKDAYGYNAAFIVINQLYKQSVTAWTNALRLEQMPLNRSLNKCNDGLEQMLYYKDIKVRSKRSGEATSKYTS